jgi:hypothetical protein
VDPKEFGGVPVCDGVEWPSALVDGIEAVNRDSWLSSALLIGDDVPRPVMTTATIICSSGPKSLNVSDA